jgi:hypothetical protein
MTDDSNSNARCIKAVELTIRFVVTCAVPLAFLLFAVCMFFERGYKPALDVGLLILLLYFIVAYRNVGRGNKTSIIIAGLAGYTAANAVAAVYSNDAGDSSMEFNPATGLMMIGDFDTAGNFYGCGTMAGETSGDDASWFDDNHLSFNPANGLLMVNDAIDIHGNAFGNNSMDDLMDYNSSTIDDSITHTSFDDSFNCGTFDDDWNK